MGADQMMGGGACKEFSSPLEGGPPVIPESKLIPGPGGQKPTHQLLPNPQGCPAWQAASASGPLLAVQSDSLAPRGHAPAPPQHSRLT